MNQPSATGINFADTIGVLASGQIWEYETGTPGKCRDVPGQTFAALHTPVDFPPIEAAIVPGDRVALAVDPNVPGIVEVIQGTIKALGQTEASDIDIVLGDEASDETVQAIQDEVGEETRVVRHQSTDRSWLRYVGADESADPVYLNRLLVDADFVVPIVSGRPLDTYAQHDLTGVYPPFADSATRIRHRQQTVSSSRKSKASAANVTEPSWLLGVQIMLSVTASDDGRPGQIIAGTPDAVRKQLTPSRRLPDEFPPPAPLVIAAMDGDGQQQSWSNAARAFAAASRYAEAGGTILLWSAIADPPSGRLLSLADNVKLAEEEAVEVTADGDFPCWDEPTGLAHTIARIAEEYRLLIHSRLDDETIESMGLASISSNEELARLSQSFDTCGVVRAAQFAGTTIDTPVQLA